MADAESRFPLLRKRLEEWQTTHSTTEGDPPTKRRRELSEAETWLHAKWGNEMSCPGCGGQPFALGTPVNFQLADGVLSAPFVPLACEGCGLTTFIDLRVICRKGEPPELKDSN